MEIVERPVVFLVEGDEDKRIAFEKNLEEFNFQVFSAGSKKEFEELMRRGLDVDAILCDASLEDGYGHEVCYNYLNSLKNVFIAGMSSNGSNRICWNRIASHETFYVKNLFYKKEKLIVGDIFSRDFAHYKHILGKLKNFYEHKD
jgi:DNA-binding NtrC family response regulator